MRVSRTTLWEARRQVMSNIKTMLEDAAVEDGLLEGVKSVVTARRQEYQPDVPVIWVFRGAAENSHPPRSQYRAYKMPVFMVAVVEDEDPASAADLAEEYAERAIEVILTDRRLGLDYVHDIVDVRVQPDEPGHTHTTAAAAGVIEVNMVIASPDPS